MPEIYENRQAKVKEIVEDMLRERKQQKDVCFYNSRIRELCLLAYWLKLRCGQWQSHVVKKLFYNNGCVIVVVLVDNNNNKKKNDNNNNKYYYCYY